MPTCIRVDPAPAHARVARLRLLPARSPGGGIPHCDSHRGRDARRRARADRGALSRGARPRREGLACGGDRAVRACRDDGAAADHRAALAEDGACRLDPRRHPRRGARGTERDCRRDRGHRGARREPARRPDAPAQSPGLRAQLALPQRARCTPRRSTGRASAIPRTCCPPTRIRRSLAHRPPRVPKRRRSPRSCCVSRRTIRSLSASTCTKTT